MPGLSGDVGQRAQHQTDDWHSICQVHVVRTSTKDKTHVAARAAQGLSFRDYPEASLQLLDITRLRILE